MSWGIFGLLLWGRNDLGRSLDWSRRFNFFFWMLLWGCWNLWILVFFLMLPPSSTCESPLSLLRFRFTAKSIFSSCFSFDVDDNGFALWVITFDVDDDDFVVARVVSVVFIVFDDDDGDGFVVAVVIVCVFSDGTFLTGDFFFLLVTWVHPSFALSGSFSVSVWGSFCWRGGFFPLWWLLWLLLLLSVLPYLPTPPFGQDTTQGQF